MMKNLINHLTLNQREAQPGSTQVPNSAGGYVWEASIWTRLDRFLVLGTGSGTYYASERALTRDNAKAIMAALDEDGVRAVDRIVEMSTSGRTPSNTPAVFALAVALKLGNLGTRRAAAAAVSKVCRTGTHLFQLADAVQAFGGWGRLTQTAFQNWYTERSAESLAYQAVKYQRRGGWSARDVLRKAHPKPATAAHDEVLKWIVKGWTGPFPLSPPDETSVMIWAHERVKLADSATDVASLIEDFGLVRESIPTRWLHERTVWEALLMSGRGMPMTAMLRNLAKLTHVGVLRPNSAAAGIVAERLVDTERLSRARIHPIQILNALVTYRGGKGVRGSLTWRPVPAVVDALEASFHLAFRFVEPTNKRWMLALDVSGSMGSGSLCGLPSLSPRMGSVAMAMATARVESKYEMISFQDSIVDLSISASDSLTSALKQVYGLPFGRTDCAQPMLHAMRNKIETDVFVVYTDSETWFGDVHPAAALRNYRQTMGIDAKLVVVGMVSNGFTIADPNDAGMLDIVGFDAAAPSVLADFAR